MPPEFFAYPGQSRSSTFRYSIFQVQRNRPCYARYGVRSGLVLGNLTIWKKTGRYSFAKRKQSFNRQEGSYIK